MKRLIIISSLAVAYLSANAEGYQVNTFSTKQNGMGHVGVAMKLGAESNIFNPAAVAFSNKTLDLSAGVSAIVPTATCTVDGTKYETSNKTSTPFNVSTAFRIYDNLYAGVSLYTPYGSSINWGENWAGAILNQSVDLKVFSVQPTLSWRILPNLSVGAGMIISWGSVDLNKGLVSPESFNHFLPIAGLSTGQQMPAYTSTATPASVNLNGTSDLALGFNVGAMYDINNNWTVGASFRSHMDMDVKKGDAQVTYANALAESVLGGTLNLLNETNFSASMPCPYLLTAGVSYKPTDRLILAFDAQLNGWSAYKQLDIEFEGLPAYGQHITKDYKDSWTLHLGGQYTMTERLDLRAGLMMDFSPVNDSYYNPETPGMTKIEPAVGFSFRPIPNLSIDASFMYVAGVGADNKSVTYTNMLAPAANAKIDQAIATNPAAAAVLSGMKMPVEGEFTADYTAHALIPALGISYAF